MTHLESGRLRSERQASTEEVGRSEEVEVGEPCSLRQYGGG